MALKPIEKVSPPPTDPANPHQGAVAGRITTTNTSQGLSGAYVAIVNAANTSQAFYESRSNESGFFKFPAVNCHAYGSYRVYASLDGVGEGYSNLFAVAENTTAPVNIVIAYFEQPAATPTSGDIVQHVPMPDGIMLSARPDTVSTGGSDSTIVAQLYLNGEPYKRSGVTVTFFENNATIAFLPPVKTGVTDTNGQAVINLTPGKVAGNVTVTGYSLVGISRNITGDCTVHVSNASAGNVVDSNASAAQNITATARVNRSEPNATLNSSTQIPEPVSGTATPAPTEAGTGAAGSPAVYTLLLITLAAVAGLTVYAVVFRKK